MARALHGRSLFCSEALKGNFANAASNGTIIIGLKNLLSEQEIEQKITENIVNKK
jgi:PTS system ascorbate-specific IIB component